MSPTAFVTGASRGIGKAIAIALAEVGYDVAVTARTVNEGEAREHSSSIKRSDTSPLPGSLSGTAALIEAEGQRALAVPADLLDAQSLESAVKRVISEWGQIDLLVNNGRYIGQGHMDHFVEYPIELMEKQLEANVMAPLRLIRMVLPGMIERNNGVIINVTSLAAVEDPPAAAGEGGWGLGYGVTKGALHRAAGILALEVANTDIRIYNLAPGLVRTERLETEIGMFNIPIEERGAPPRAIGAAVKWLLTDPDAREPLGRTIEAQDEVRDRKLLPDWP
jgi:NAD(P)-dependent dehydrogenase (short-subunit alcohol dehydrogenase family)